MKESFKDYGIDGVNISSGGTQVTTCPKCSHTRKKKNVKCLTVWVDSGTWNCNHSSCGWKGSLKSASYAKKEEKLKTIPDTQKQLTPSELTLKYLVGRGLTAEVINRNKIQNEKIWMPQTGKEENAICFNFYKRGKIVNVKYRDGSKNFRQAKNAEKIFYKLDDIAPEAFIIESKTSTATSAIKPWCIITEGEMDALSYEVSGYKNCISVPDGAPNPDAKNLDNKFDYITNCAEELELMTKVYLSLDADEPGVFLRDELARRLGKHICWIVKYPKGCKDANEVLKEHGAEALKRCIDDAEPYPIRDILTVKNFEQEIDLLYEKGFDTGVTVGYDTGYVNKTKEIYSFDELISFKTGMLTSVTGIPQAGKSNFVEQLAMLLNVFKEWKVGMFSPEHYPMSIMFVRLAKILTGKPFFDGRESRMTQEELAYSKEYLDKNFFFVRPENEVFTLEAILDSVKALVLRYGIKLFIIDPWNTIHHDKKGLNETDYVEWALNYINDFKQKYDIHIIIIGHPKKMEKKDGVFLVPTPYDVSGSSHWFNKPDNCMTVYRNYDKNEVEIYVHKVKFEHLGRQGMAVFKWNGVNSRYYPKTTEPYNTMYSVQKGFDLVNKEGLNPPKTQESADDIDLEDLPF